MAINDTKIAGVSPSEVPQKYPLSKVSLTMGILSLCLLPILGLPGFICGLLAASKEKPAKKYYLPGIVTSLISFALVIIVGIVIRVILSALGLSFSDFSSIESIKSIDLEPIFEVIAKPFI